ncbi:MAG: hypothetical protein SNI70_11030 [Rikenellaceae bacterium]
MVTISDLGVVAIPSTPIQMTIYEIAELFDVFAPTTKARINAILKSKSTTYYNRERFAMPTYFDLEMIIGVAFAVDSYKAEIFRRYIIGRVAAPNVQPIYIGVDMQRVNNVLS